MSNCSVQKSIRVEISYDIPDECCLKAFNNIQDFFKEEYQKYKDLNLKKALSALDLDDKEFNEEEPILCQEYRRVWNITDDDINQSHYQELSDIIKQWYSDWHELSLHNKDYNRKKILLHQALEDCNLEQVINIFKNVPQNL